MNRWFCPYCGKTGRETNATKARNAGMAHYDAAHHPTTRPREK